MYPGVSLVHMLKSKIESILDNDELALESARDAVALCPEDKSLGAYVDLLEEKCAGHNDARFQKTTHDEAIKKIKSDSR